MEAYNLEDLGDTWGRKRTSGGAIYYRMPEDAYHADPCPTPSMSVSLAKVQINSSPRHARLSHPRLGGKAWAPSDKMDNGSLAHKLLLGSGPAVHTVDADDWRTAKAKAERDHHRGLGKIVVLRKQMDAAPEMAEAWRTNLLHDHGITIPSVTEATMLWDDLGTWCRARVDAIDEDGLIIYDLKLSGIAHSKSALERHFLSMGYGIQAAAYTRGAERTHYETAGRWKFRFLVLEPEEPFCVTPVDLDSSFLELGQLQWDRAVSTWGRCLASNLWAPPPAVTISARPWAIMEEAEKTYADI